jgi:DeoR/GlpR family transcriptional regulator of sugar metabolism
VKTMIKYSQKVVTLATSSKTNTAEAFFISPVSELYMLITDANPEDNANKAFRDLGIKVL